MFGNIADLYPFELEQPENPIGYILIADDNEHSLKIRVCRLAKMGYYMHTATNGEEAIAKVKENPDKYDIILMNYKMPMCNGIQATRVIRRNYNFKNPIIGYSAGLFLNEDTHDAGIKAGMNSCVDANEMIVLDEMIRLLYIEPEKEKYRKENKPKSWFTKLKELIIKN